MINKSTIIGVAGGTGSGKTTFANKLIGDLDEEDVLILCHDYYYKSHDSLTLDERKKLNYDHPDAFDTELMIDHLLKLQNGQAIYRPQYSFVEHKRLEEQIKVEPKKIIVVEGILIFENKKLADLMDIKLFVDTDADIRFIRRLMRDVEERGRTLNSVVNQYITTVKPMHEKFVEPSKKNADVVVLEGGMNKVALKMLVDRINSIIKENK